MKACFGASAQLLQERHDETRTNAREVTSGDAKARKLLTRRRTTRSNRAASGNWRLPGVERGGKRHFGRASGTGERDRLRRVTTPLEIRPAKNRRWEQLELIRRGKGKRSQKEVNGTMGDFEDAKFNKTARRKKKATEEK
jgi:hypothetical protein